MQVTVRVAIYVCYRVHVNYYVEHKVIHDTYRDTRYVNAPFRIYKMSVGIQTQQKKNMQGTALRIRPYVYI